MNLDDLRARQHDERRLPSDIRAAAWFASLTPADATHATEDRLLTLTPAEIALLRPTRRNTAA